MNRSIRLLSVLALGVSAIAIAPSAHADEKFSLHLDPGIVQPLTAPQDNIYQTGMTMAARGMFNLKPWLSIGPSVSADYLPKSIDNGSNAGVLWQFGGAVRLQRTHNLFNDDGVWSPYVNLDLMAAHTGNLWRPAFDVQVGMDVATDVQHSFWFGPYVGYQHVFQTSGFQDGLALDRHDPNLLTVGLSLTFDFPPHAHVVHERVIENRVVRIPGSTVVIHDQAQMVAAVPEKLEFKEHVYFDWDKSVLRWESKDKLDAVIAKLNAHKTVAVHVQGHASSDGQKAHNEVLAAARAESVRQYLVAHGVDASRLTVDNFGVDRPAADNKVQEGRERSRRVEFEVTFTSN
jgi:outer membrane protein OmpA-like peptidoglycan-associated protein